MDWSTILRVTVFLVFVAGALAYVATLRWQYNGYDVPRLLICIHGAVFFGALVCRGFGWCCCKLPALTVNLWSFVFYLHIGFTLLGVASMSLAHKVNGR